jgi:hypothetical protein
MLFVHPHILSSTSASGDRPVIQSNHGSEIGQAFARLTRRVLPRKHVWTKILAGDWVEFYLHLNSVGTLTSAEMAGVASGGLSAAITAVPH